MKKRALQVLMVLGLAGVLFGGGAVGAVAWVVHESVQENCDMAQQAHPHPGDDAAALTDFIHSSTHSFQERNHAIWTLGRLSDPKALPALEAVYTGDLCNHNTTLCQYELEKAIKRCGGIPNPPREIRH
ncbi:MAG: hypothetical protein RBU21_19515 [FCB group bacterium]|jgi:hypothetical protein|nr:hypothetical protein [FCB group bacterium]